MKIEIINGPNLNFLGRREPQIYGNKTFEEYFEALKKIFPKAELSYFQSNHEGEIIDKIQAGNDVYDSIVLNAGAFTHTSIALADCVSSVQVPVIEVHISNIFSRESFREKSYLSSVCKGIISGFGLFSYRLAIEYCLQASKYHNL